MLSTPGREGPSARTSDGCVIVFHRTGTRGKRIGSGRFGSFVRLPNLGVLREGRVNRCHQVSERTHDVRGQNPSICSRLNRGWQECFAPTVFRCNRGCPLTSSSSTATIISDWLGWSLRATYQSPEGECEDLIKFNGRDETAHLRRGLRRGLQT